ncbi:alcohol dehydrogenase like domain-containing protein [Fusarium mexicanum]|uniref:Alcohol dehydrogenase like domain-containing protein n=1 Tax=Fusarium mexicanum TaxID=751941 RepID=A0A8H5MKU7_9HYPO|nr:alcohol dehydrogenase like domain-containing protein [Fusarium mexicanum]
MKALVGAGIGGYSLANEVDKPVPQPGSVLCHVRAVALNPHDAKIVDYSNAPGALGGCDFAGVVVQVGDGVKRFKEGDRLFAVTFGMNASDKTAGAFAQYALATEDLSCHIPETIPFTEACSMGLAIATAGLALFQEPGLQLPMQGGNGETVLISGGATAIGTMATQMLRIYVLDCVVDTSTMKMNYNAIGSSGGAYVALESIPTNIKYTRRDIRANWLMAPSILGTRVNKKGAYGRPCVPQHRQFGAYLFALAERWLQDGSIKPHPLEIREGGLGSICEGINDLRIGAVHAKKLVYPLSA